jgi:hypothetical protein
MTYDELSEDEIDTRVNPKPQGSGGDRWQRLYNQELTKNLKPITQAEYIEGEICHKYNY